MRLGSHHSEEARASISAAKTNPSLETLAKLSTSHMKHVVSPETRAKISAFQQGNTRRLGSCLSEETKAKISAGMMGHKNELGHHRSIETKAAVSIIMMGNKNAPWMGGQRATNARMRAKRRSMDYAYLNAWFVGCEGHHVDNEQIINIPRELHRSKGNHHNHFTGLGMAQINAIAYNFLFKQEAEAALGGTP